MITESTDGTVTIATPDGAMKVTSQDGTITTISPDGTITITFSDGTSIQALPDGTTVEILPDGTVIKTLPDGTVVKTLTDGRTITIPPGSTGLHNTETPKQFFAKNVEKNQNIERQNTGTEPGSNLPNIELNSVVAGLTGWGLASSRSTNGQSVLNRESFRNLDRERDNRRFLRWRKGRFVDFGQGGSSGTRLV